MATLIKFCSVEECERKHKAHGYCSMHYRRVLSNGSPFRPRDGRECEVELCARKCTRKLYCDKHYYRFKKHGDPLLSQERYMVKDKSKKEIFLEKIEITPDNECWNWMGSKNSWGYGRIAFKSTHQAAHRYAYDEFKGAIPASMLVCHNCDNPGCVNPDHLFLGTPADNMADMSRKGRHIGARKLNEDKVREIRALLKSELTHKAIAVKYGVGRSAIGAISTKQTWSHIKD